MRNIQEGKVILSALIDEKTRKDFDQLCKKYKLKKNKFIETLIKDILIRDADGSIKRSNGYVTVNILKEFNRGG